MMHVPRKPGIVTPEERVSAVATLRALADTLPGVAPVDLPLSRAVTTLAGPSLRDDLAVLLDRAEELGLRVSVTMSVELQPPALPHPPTGAYSGAYSAEHIIAITRRLAPESVCIIRGHHVDVRAVSPEHMVLVHRVLRDSLPAGMTHSVLSRLDGDE
jgi:hypothetical protein